MTSSLWIFYTVHLIQLQVVSSPQRMNTPVPCCWWTELNICHDKRPCDVSVTRSFPREKTSIVSVPSVLNYYMSVSPVCQHFLNLYMFCFLSTLLYLTILCIILFRHPVQRRVSSETECGALHSLQRETRHI